MSKSKLFLIICGISISFWQCAENPMSAEMEKEVEIEILGGRFNPGSITIDVGSRVVWINKDNATHSVDSGTFMNPTNDFGSPNILPDGNPWPNTFTKVGTFNYYCLLHQTGTLKQGTIIVE